jgi:hypothetical protein
MKRTQWCIVVIVVGCCFSVGVAGMVGAAAPAPAAQTGGGLAGVPASSTTWDRLIETEIGQAFTQGKFSFNARLRWEHADQDGLEASDAVTIRPRFGFTTAPAYGFQGMIEAENITSLGAAYNPAGLDPDETDRTVIADPETTEINQAWLSYSHWDSTVRGGRQRIALDTHRFVGDVGWRQNMQTFDAIFARTDVVPSVSVQYGYLWRINRVLGDDHPEGNWDSDSHLINVSYELCPELRITGYGYLLDFDNSPVNSSSTAGASLAGGLEVSERVRLEYRGEVAWQTDAGDNPNAYDAWYYTLEWTARMKPFLVGAGYEVLGSDNDGAFRTPLATLHKFNGWADVFVVTPDEGLQDFWVQGGVTLPLEMPLRVVYHRFWSDHGNEDLGQELDVELSRKFGPHFTALAKYAWFDGDSGLADVHRFWLQAEFNY